MIIPSVVEAFLSFANWNLSFFWWLCVFGLALVSNVLLFGFCMMGITGGLPSIGHCDSLLLRDVKHCPRVVLSKLYCKQKRIVSALTITLKDGILKLKIREIKLISL